MFVEYEGEGEVITECIKITTPDEGDRSDQDEDVALSEKTEWRHTRQISTGNKRANAGRNK